MQTYAPYFGQCSFIEYAHGAMMVAHHVGVCYNEVYDDLETDLFQRIERTTGHPRKVLGLNSFEIEAAKK